MGLRSVQRLDAGGGECWTNRALSFIEKQGSCLRDVSSGETVRISCICVVGWQDSEAVPFLINLVSFSL